MHAELNHYISLVVIKVDTWLESIDLEFHSILLFLALLNFFLFLVNIWLIITFALENLSGILPEHIITFSYLFRIRPLDIFTGLFLWFLGLRFVNLFPLLSLDIKPEVVHLHIDLHISSIYIWIDLIWWFNINFDLTRADLLNLLNLIDVFVFFFLQG